MYNSYDCNKWSLRTGTVGVSNKGFAIVDDICNATRIQINGAGNVGIGTCNPTDKLDIYGNDTNGAIVIRGGSSQTGRNIYLFSGGINATGTLLGVTKCVNQFIIVYFCILQKIEFK